MTMQLQAGAAAAQVAAPGNLAWHALPVEEAAADVGSGPDGLSAGEAGQRLASVGPNVLERRSAEGPLTILWRQINSPLIWVLLAASLLAVAVGKVTDGLVVLAVVVLNSLIGFLQEYRANRAIEALRGMVPENVVALRDGRRTTVPAADLVPGDVVLLASGDKVPADLRLIAAKTLRVEEAALTGESVPVEKAVRPVGEDAPIGDRTSMAYAGTLVAYGTGSGLVVATGGRTELGRISTLLQQAVALETPLTKALARIGKLITLAIVAAAAVMLAIGLARATAAGVALAEAARETLVFAIALAVGAIPEGLPAIVTIALAIGVQRMASRRAIIRKLPAVETLGSTTVICSDKTGTLTRNEMTVLEVWTPGEGACRVEGVGYAPVGGFRPDAAQEFGPAPQAVRGLLDDAVLCNDAALHQADGAWTISGDPTEAALVVAARKAGIDAEEARARSPRLDAIPFESENQFMATLHAQGGAARLVVKGAPEVILRLCAGTPGQPDAAAVHREVERLAGEGMRVLALAHKPWDDAARELGLADVAGGLRFAGLVGMIDPPRPEAIAAVRACRQAGIAVKMITGDHLATARAIGAQLGLDGTQGALTGAALAELDDEALRRAIATTAVFARVAPEHKLRLVRALQDMDNVVAMTGDGVNDAPALRQANIGVAMGITGTSVSKEAADMVLTDDNFASIVAAVEEGRRVYDNLIKSLAFVLPTNLGPVRRADPAAAAADRADPDPVDQPRGHGRAGAAARLRGARARRHAPAAASPGRAGALALRRRAHASGRAGHDRRRGRAVPVGVRRLLGPGRRARRGAGRGADHVGDHGDPVPDLLPARLPLAARTGASQRARRQSVDLRRHRRAAAASGGVHLRATAAGGVRLGAARGGRPAARRAGRRPGPAGGGHREEPVAPPRVSGGRDAQSPSRLLMPLLMFSMPMAIAMRWRICAATTWTISSSCRTTKRRAPGCGSASRIAFSIASKLLPPWPATW